LPIGILADEVGERTMLAVLGAASVVVMVLVALWFHGRASSEVPTEPSEPAESATIDERPRV
jgi:hypothetical protein